MAAKKKTQETVRGDDAFFAQITKSRIDSFIADEKKEAKRKKNEVAEAIKVTKKSAGEQRRLYESTIKARLKVVGKRGR